jgi:hypothetical protein
LTVLFAAYTYSFAPILFSAAGLEFRFELAGQTLDPKKAQNHPQEIMNVRPKVPATIEEEQT